LPEDKNTFSKGWGSWTGLGIVEPKGPSKEEI